MSVPGAFTLSGQESATTPGLLELSWTPSSGATTYDVYINSALEVSGLTGTTYNVQKSTAFTYDPIYVQAINLAGSRNSNFITITTKPAIVSGVNLSFNTVNNELTISFSTQNVLNYKIYLTTTQGSSTLTAPNSPYIYTVTPLEVGLIRVRVSAVNAAGEGPQSPESSITVAPSIFVTDLSANQNVADNSLLDITWTPPSTTQLFYYKIGILFNTPDYTYYFVSGINKSSYQYQMTVYSNYTVSVQMSYDNVTYFGPRNTSKLVTSTTQPPKPPTNLLIISRTGFWNGSASTVNLVFSWTPSFGADGYKIYYNNGTSSSSQGGLPITLTYTNEETQTFTIRGVNSYGESVDSSGLTTTVYLPISPPQNIQVAVGSGQASFTWQAPAFQHHSFPSYRLTITGGPSPLTYDISSNLLSYTATGLTNGTTYSASLKANDPLIDSIAGGTAPFTPAALPDPPGQVQNLRRNSGQPFYEARYDGTNTFIVVPLAWDPVSGSGITYNIYVNGTLAIGGHNGLDYDINSYITGSITYSVRARDSYGQLGPAATLTLDVPSSSSVIRNIELTTGNNAMILSWLNPAVTPRTYQNVTTYIFDNTSGQDLIGILNPNYFQNGYYINSLEFQGVTTPIQNGKSYSALMFVDEYPLVLGPQNSSGPPVTVTGSPSPNYPNPPTGLQLIGQEAGTLNGVFGTYYTFSWTAPASGDAPIFYQIYQNGNPYATSATTSRTLFTEYPGYYTIDVAGVNLGDEGYNSAPLSFNVYSPFNEPTSVSATTGDAQATVSWTTPSITPRPITSYVVKVYTQSDLVNPVRTVYTPNDQTSILVTGLTNGVAYVATVAVYEDYITNSVSAASSPFAPEEVVQPPTILTYTTQTIASTPPATRATITYSGINAASYRVSVNGVLRQNSSATSFSLDVSGADGSYTFSVVSVSASSAQSAPTTRTEYIYAPIPAPTVSGEIIPGVGFLNVTWIAPSQTPRAITSYTAVAKLGGATIATYTTNDDALREAKLYGLTAGTSYSVYVSANPGPSVQSDVAYGTPLSEVTESGVVADLSGIDITGVPPGTTIPGPTITTPFTGTTVPSKVVVPPTDPTVPVQVDIPSISVPINLFPQEGADKVIFAYEASDENNIQFFSNVIETAPSSIPVKLPIESVDTFTIVSVDAAGNQITGNETKLDLGDLITLRGYDNPILIHFNSAGIPDNYYTPVNGIFSFSENPTLSLVEGTAEQGGAPIVNDEAQCPCAVRGYTLNLSTDRTQTTETVNRSNSVLASSYVSNPQLYKRMDYSTLLRIKMGFAGRGK